MFLRFIYLIYFHPFESTGTEKKAEREREIDFPLLVQSQVLTPARAGPGQIQEEATPCRYLRWVAGPQALEPSSAASHVALAGSWMGRGGTGPPTGISIQYLGFQVANLLGSISSSLDIVGSFSMSWSLDSWTVLWNVEDLPGEIRLRTWSLLNLDVHIFSTIWDTFSCSISE